MPSSRAWRHAIASAAKADAASKFILTLDPTGASHLFGEESRLKMPYGSGNERALVQRLPCCKGNCRMITCALWAIWANRNRFLHEGESRSGSQVADFVLNYLKELDDLNHFFPIFEEPILLKYEQL
ncbi:uncharacterized protein LOC108474552 isoform X2 [Gossypium arboreum]|uniref:uncharacterized protein LOC108474552 isoform X2 n=1 Tax=Gossypium arboreum TaxID=29729 RepID=UPI0022F18D80|nr:uncharacterized protein LOC108474552 isoform X2 [Gossypium arboreum]